MDENSIVKLLLENAPTIAALFYIIFFQDRQIKAKRTENETLREENDKLRLKNEQLYLRIIGHFEAQVTGKRSRLAKPMPSEDEGIG